MSAELEGRIRASLRAYADLVEEVADDDVLPVRRPRSAVRRWRAPLLVAAAVAVGVTVPVWLGLSLSGSGGSSTVAAPSAESEAQGAEVLRTPEDSAADAAAGAAEAASPLAVGVPVPFELYTHCGVVGADLGGIWFAADTPLVDTSGNPPAGWDNPYQSGTVTLLTADTALFQDDAGHELRLRAAPDERPPPCQ